MGTPIPSVHTRWSLVFISLDHDMSLDRNFLTNSNSILHSILHLLMLIVRLITIPQPRSVGGGSPHHLLEACDPKEKQLHI